MDKKRIVVVGTGSIGLRHARLCLRRGDLQVEVCDSRKDGLIEAAKTLGSVRVWESLSAVLDSRPDFIIVATPHHLHAEMACAAMRAGSHVLCEKPMSDTIGGAATMAETARQTRRVCRIGFMLRFHPTVARLRTVWINGDLGQVISLRYSVGAFETLENSRSRYQATLRGALVMDYSHGLDLITWLGGQEPVGVYARGLRAGNFPHSSDPTIVSALLDFSAPYLAEVHLNYATQPATHDFHVVGDKATARVDLLRGTLELRNRGKNTVSEVSCPFERDDLYVAQLDHFFAAIDSRDSWGCTPDEGLRATRVAEAILRAMDQNERVTLSP